LKKNVYTFAFSFITSYHMQKIKLIIVDDDDTYRRGINLTVKIGQPDFIITGEVKYGADLFDLLDSGVEADIVLLDITLPAGMNGIDVARRLKTERPAMKILVVSSDNSAETIEQMLDIEVDGFISKVETDPEKTLDVARMVVQGLTYFGRDISEIISRIYMTKKKQMEVTSEFSEQEKRVIEFSHEGLPAKLIAERMNISASAVNWHKSNIFRKLGINNSLEMVRFAVTKGIIRA